MATRVDGGWTAPRAHRDAVLAVGRVRIGGGGGIGGIGGGGGGGGGGTASAACWQRRRRRGWTLSGASLCGLLPRWLGIGSTTGEEAERARAALAERAVELRVRRHAKWLATGAARVVPSEVRPAASGGPRQRSGGITMARRRVSGPPRARRRAFLLHVLNHVHPAVEGRHAQLQPRLPQ